MLMFLLLALSDPLTIQIDRAIFAAFVTVALFFLTHIIIALKWGTKVGSDVQHLVQEVSSLSAELHSIRDVIAKFSVTDAAVSRNAKDIEQLYSRMREIERYLSNAPKSSGS